MATGASASSSQPDPWQRAGCWQIGAAQQSVVAFVSQIVPTGGVWQSCRGIQTPASSSDGRGFGP
eukprot:2850513-Lingulodinium_polyedra.AAC.1